jgi:hypothetical protein
MLMLLGSFICCWLDVIKICCLSAIFANPTFIIVSLPVPLKEIFIVSPQF